MSDLVFESSTTMDQPAFATWIAGRPDHDEHHYELLGGRVVMTPPAGWPHGNVASRLQYLMVAAAEQGAASAGSLPGALGVGLVFDSSQGFELTTGDTVEPDASFVSIERWRAAPPPEHGRFLVVVPDLVVEILSSSTASRDRGEKRAIYAAAGVREYVLVDPRARTIQVFTRVAIGLFDVGPMFAEDALWRSAVLPGLCLSADGLLPP